MRLQTALHAAQVADRRRDAALAALRADDPSVAQRLQELQEGRDAVSRQAEYVPVCIATLPTATQGVVRCFHLINTSLQLCNRTPHLA